MSVRMDDGMEGLHGGRLGCVASVLQVAGFCGYGCAYHGAGDWGQYGDLHAGACDSDEVTAGGGPEDSISGGGSGRLLRQWRLYQRQRGLRPLLVRVV